jgi:hypothetical protein
MENSNKIFNDMLSKLQECLNEFKCKSEIRLSDQEAILYGKFAHSMERYTVVIHIKEENYIPVAIGAGKIKAKEDDTKKIIFPNLNLQFFKADKSNCSQEEQIALKNNFIENANEIGREFLRKINK